jgi:MFS family permease
VHHFSASESGLALIPLMASVVVAAISTGRAMLHVDNYKRIPLVGLTVSIVSALSLAIWPSGVPLALVLVLLALIGGGIGTLFPVSIVALQNAVQRSQMGTATGAMNFFRSLGSALVVALFGAIVLGGAGGGSGISVDALARVAPGLDFASVFRFVFLSAGLVLGFGLAFTIAMEQKPLRGPVAKEAADAPVGLSD